MHFQFSHFPALTLAEGLNEGLPHTQTDHRRVLSKSPRDICLFFNQSAKTPKIAVFAGKESQIIHKLCG